MSVDNKKKSIGERLRWLRKDRGLHMDTIIKHLKVAQSTYTGWEIGRRTPDSPTVSELAIIMNTSSDFILGNVNDDSPSTDDIAELISKKKLTYKGKELTEKDLVTLNRVIAAILNEKENEQSK